MPCASHATATVVDAPMKMYQVKASAVQPHTTVMMMRPASIPAKACLSVMDGASVPRRNAPSTDPEA